MRLILALLVVFLTALAPTLAPTLATAEGLSRRMACDSWGNDIQPTEWGWAVRDCVEQGQHGPAVRAFFAYNSYILFDQQRVRDESAHVVKDELNVWIFSGYSRDQFNALKPMINQMRAKEGDFYGATCQALRDLGPPDYHPQYMIKRGMIPRKSDTDWQTEGFDSTAAWAKALSVNGC